MAATTPPPIVFIDTETTSLRLDREVWEVGLIRRDPDGTDTDYEWFVEVDNLDNADPFSLDVGRFYQRHPLGRWLSGAHRSDFPHFPAASGWYRTRQATATAVARLTHGAIIIGNVPDFDTTGLGDLIRTHGHLLPKWHYHPRDFTTLAAGYLRGRGHTLPDLPWDSDELSRALGVEPPSDEERHTALGDARWAARVWDQIMGGDR